MRIKITDEISEESQKYYDKINKGKYSKIRGIVLGFAFGLLGGLLLLIIAYLLAMYFLWAILPFRFDGFMLRGILLTGVIGAIIGWLMG